MLDTVNITCTEGTKVTVDMELAFQEGRQSEQERELTYSSQKCEGETRVWKELQEASGRAAVWGKCGQQGFPEKCHLRAGLQEVGSEPPTWRRAAWLTPEGASEVLEARRTARLEQSKPKGGNEVREVTRTRSRGALCVIST